MKPSKVENILNYNPPLDDTKTVLPLAPFQPFPSAFEPEFPLPPPQNPFLIHRWGASPTDRPLQLPGRGFAPLPSAPAPMVPSAAWGDREGQGFCNFTWRGAAPGTQRPLFPALEESRGSSARAAAGLGAYSHFPPKHEVVFRAVRNCRPHPGTPFPVENGADTMRKCDGNRYCPLMLSPLQRNINQNISKAVPGSHARPMMCNFCKNNKEVPDIYLNHYLYDPETKVLSCPVLRKHVCEICGGTGDQAHTLQYCPVNRKRGLQAKVPVLLKTRTITNSTGKIRRN